MGIIFKTFMYRCKIKLSASGELDWPPGLHVFLSQDTSGNTHLKFSPSQDLYIGKICFHLNVLATEYSPRSAAWDNLNCKNMSSNIFPSV